MESEMSRDQESDEMQKAIDYLIETDELHGRQKARVKALEYRLKVAKSQAFLKASGTVGEREATAYTSPEYVALVEEYEDAATDAEVTTAKRKTIELRVEIWRTRSANLRRGNI